MLRKKGSELACQMRELVVVFSCRGWIVAALRMPVHHTWRPLGGTRTIPYDENRRNAFCRRRDAFLDHRQNVRCILAERFCYEVDIAGKLVMADERRPKRATKVKPSWKMTGMSRLFAWFCNSLQKTRTTSFCGESVVERGFIRGTIG